MPPAERRLVHLAYRALARIQPHVNSAAFIIEQHSQDPTDDAQLPKDKVAFLLRRSAALIDARTRGASTSELDLAGLDTTMNSLVASAVKHIDNDEYGAWDLLALLSAIKEICRIWVQ